MSTDDPYASPGEDPSAEVPVDCPCCGARLVEGAVQGSLRWLPSDAGMLQRFVGGKHITGSRSFRITLGPARRAALHCPACGTTLILPGG